MTQEVCPHCGSSLKKYWHRLTPGLVKTLVKVYKAVSIKQENRVTKNDLNLSHSEYGNFQKLRFHALIAKVKVDGKWDRRSWLLTKRAGDFLKGRIDVPYRVQTFRNEVVGHDARRVFVKDVTDVTPYFESYEDFKNQFDFMELPEELVTAPIVKTIKKRGKKFFCSCGGRVLNRLIVVGETLHGSVITEKHAICQKCQHHFTDADPGQSAIWHTL